jgi:FkbM family methyltransferase
VRLDRYRREVGRYWRETASARDFVKLMRVRLSQSKVGPWVTPRPIAVDVDLVTLGDRVRLRSHTTDISVLNELLGGGALGRLPVGPDVTTVVDLGANTGLSYRWLRARYPTARRFVCVEPEPSNLRTLRLNAADAHCRVIGACIGARERTVGLRSDDGSWAFQMVEGGDGTAVVTMDRVLAESGIEHVDVLKCDIEGAERELFEHCESWIGRVDAMTVECHLESLDSATLVAMLAANGAEFEITHLERNPTFGLELVTLRRAAAAAG